MSKARKNLYQQRLNTEDSINCIENNELSKLEKRLQNLDWDEKYEWVHIHRLKGNMFYRSGNYDEAIQTYVTSLMGIDIEDETQGRDQKMQVELRFPIILNIATCFFKKNEYKSAISLCDRILDEEPTHLQAIYKKVFILIKSQQIQKAKKLLQKGIQIAHSTNNQKFLNFFTYLCKELRNNNQKIRLKQPEQNYHDNNLLPENSEQEILYYEDEGVLTKIFHALLDCMRPNNGKRKQY